MESRKGEGTAIAKIILVAFAVILSVSVMAVTKNVFDSNSAGTKIANELWKASPEVSNLTKLGILDEALVNSGTQVSSVMGDFFTGKRIVTVSGTTDSGSLLSERAKSLRGVVISGISYTGGTLTFETRLAGTETDALVAAGVSEVAVETISRMIESSAITTLSSIDKSSDGIVLAGAFSGTLTSDGITVVSDNTLEGVVFKISETTGKVIWMHKLDYVTSNMVPSYLKTAGSVTYLAGRYNGIFDIDGTTSPNVASGEGIAIMKIGADGTVAWMKTVLSNAGSATFGHNASSVQTDSAGNVLIAGTYNVSSINANGTILNSNGGSTDAFFLKLDGNGNTVSAKSFGSSGDEIVGFVRMADDGTFAIGGGTTDTLTIDGQTATRYAVSGTYDGYVTKFASDGTRIWLYGMGGVDRTNGGNFIGSINQYGDVLMTFRSANTVSPTSKNFTIGSQSVSGSYPDMGVAIKILNNGMIAYLNKFEGPTNTGYTPKGIVTDSVGDDYFIGDVSAVLDYPYATSAYGNADALIVKYDYAGTPVFAKTFGNSGSNSIAGSSMDSLDNLYVFGNYATSLTAGAFTITPGVSTDMYILKLDSDGNVSALKSFPANKIIAYGTKLYTIGSFNAASMTYDGVTYTRTATTSANNFFRLDQNLNLK